MQSPAFASATGISYTAAYSGAVARSQFAKDADVLSVDDFGAVGNDTTVNLIAMTNADAVNQRKLVSYGVYKTGLASTALNGPYFGYGQLRDSSNNKRGIYFSAIKAFPNQTGWNENSLETAFNGDWSKSQIAMEHRITGAATLGQPTSGYLYTPQAYPIYGYLYNSSGWNQSTTGNGGRTGAAFMRVKVDQYGQGDLVAYNATAFVTGTRAGSTNFLANPAAVLFNGDMTAGANYVYLNPRELALHDNGFDVACIGDVVNLDRTVATGGQSVWWAAYRAQSTGSAAVNCIMSATGKFNAGLDLSMSFLDFGANKAAISLKQNDRIYFNNASSTDTYTTSFNGDYITYSSGISGLNFVVGGTSVLQITNGQITSPAANIVVPNVRFTGVTPTVSAGQLGLGTSTATTATTGASGALPAQVAGYLVANLGGTSIKIPYYNV